MIERNSFPDAIGIAAEVADAQPGNSYFVMERQPVLGGWTYGVCDLAAKKFHEAEGWTTRLQIKAPRVPVRK